MARHHELRQEGVASQGEPLCSALVPHATKWAQDGARPFLALSKGSPSPAGPVGRYELGYKPKVGELSRATADTETGAIGLADLQNQASWGHKGVCELGVSIERETGCVCLRERQRQRDRQQEMRQRNREKGRVKERETNRMRQKDKNREREIIQFFC